MRSIYIQHDNWARMGNRMFQHALGHILSLKGDFHQVFHEGLPNFKISPNKNYFGSNNIRTSIYGNNYIDMDYLLTTDKDIIIDSFVQRAEYYIGYKAELRNLFNYTEKPSINNDSLVVHIRETDYTQINSFLGYDIYKRLIKDSGFSNVIIVTDNILCDTVQRLVSEGCSLNSEGTVSYFDPVSDARGMYDFETLLYSKNILISQSSFSWWGAFLGDHDTVIFPFVSTNSLWKISPDKDDISLFYNDDCNIKKIITC